MRSWIKMLIVAALGCVLIVVVVTPMVRRLWVAIQMDLSLIHISEPTRPY